MKSSTRASARTPSRETFLDIGRELRRGAGNYSRREQSGRKRQRVQRGSRRAPFVLRATVAALAPALALAAVSCVPGPTEYFGWYAIHSLKGEIIPQAVEAAEYGGLAQISGLFRANGYRPDQAQTPLFATNSTVHGSALALFTRGEAVIRVLNAMGTDALFVDSREFAFGAQRLEELSRIAEFPFVAANLRDDQGRIPGYLKPYYYHHESSTAYIGLVSPLLIERNLPIYTEGLSLADPIQVVREQVAALRALPEAPATIVLMAVGFKQSVDGSEPALADFLEIDGLNVLVLGSRETRIIHPFIEQTPTGKALIILENDAVLDSARNVEVAKIHRVSLTADQRLLSTVTGKVAPDPAIAEAVFRNTAAAQEALRSRIARLPAPLAHVHDWESPLANYVLDTYLRFSGADVAVINSGALRGRLVAGSLSLSDLYQVMPFQNNLVTLEVSGELILSLLRKSLAYRDSPARLNGFLQVGGLTFDVARRLVPMDEGPGGGAAESGATNGSGAADGQTAGTTNNSGGFQFRDFLVEDSVRIRGRPLVRTTTYSLVTEQFLAAGGDGYTELAGAPVLEVYPVLNFSVFVDSFRSPETIELPSLGRMNRVGGGQ